MSGAALRAARANRDFGTDEKRIRTKITVMDKRKNGLGLLLSKIADRAWIAFHPCSIGDPRGRLLVRATAKPCNNGARFRPPRMAVRTGIALN